MKKLFFFLSLFLIMGMVKVNAKATFTCSSNVSAYRTHYLSNAFDGNQDTYYWSDDYWSTGKYILLTFSDYIKLKQFNVYCPSGANILYSGNVLQVSTDNNIWTNVSTFSNSSTNTFNTSNSAACSCIKYVRIYATSGAAYWAKVAEITVDYEDAVPPSIDVKTNNVAGGSITFNQKVAFVSGNSAYANIVKGEETVGKALLTLKEGDAATLNVEMPQALTAGDYTLVLDASTVKSATDSTLVNTKKELSFTSNGTPALQVTTPYNNSYVESAPDKLFFLFNKEITVADIEGLTVEVEGQGSIDLTAENLEVMDGNTLVAKIDELSNLPSGTTVNAKVKLLGVWETYEFTYHVQEALAIKSADIAEGYITFNQKIDFVEGESAYANIVKGEEIIGKALLTRDVEDETYCNLRVELPQALEAGDYKLQLAYATVQSAITWMDNEAEEIEFTTEGTPALQVTTPANNAVIIKAPEKLNLVFSTEISVAKVEFLNIIVSGQGEMLVPADSLKVIDGETLVVNTNNFAAVDFIPGTDITTTVKFSGVWEPYTFKFTVDPVALLVEKINAIGEVTFTDSCKAKIDAAREAYDALSSFEKKYVDEDKYKVLTDAEEEYARLKKEFETVIFTTDDKYISTLTEVEKPITVNLATNRPLSAVQFTVTLPENVSVVEGSIQQGNILADDSFHVNVNKNKYGQYVFVVTINNDEAFKTTVEDASLLTFKVKADSAVASDVILFENILASTNDSVPTLVRIDPAKMDYSARLLIRGDADMDRSITVNDYNYARHYILEMMPMPEVATAEFLSADANNDTIINVVDVQTIAALITGEYGDKAKAFTLAAQTVEGLSIVRNGNELTIVADNASQFQGFQMDITLPAGVKVVSKHTDADHSIMGNNVNGAYRILVTSQNVCTFSNNVLATLTLSDDADVVASNIIFANTNYQGVKAEMGTVTGVKNANADVNVNVNNGKYIKNGNLVIMKNGKQYNVNGQIR